MRGGQETAGAEADSDIAPCLCSKARTTRVPSIHQRERGCSQRTRVWAWTRSTAAALIGVPAAPVVAGGVVGKFQGRDGVAGPGAKDSAGAG